MEYLKLSPTIDSDPDIEEAGWVGARVFELLLKVCAAGDMKGRIGPQHQRPTWLARRWNLTANDLPGIEPTKFITTGIQRLIDVGLLSIIDGDLVIRGWEKFYKPVQSGAERTRNWRERHANVTRDEVTLPRHCDATPLHSTPLHNTCLKETYVELQNLQPADLNGESNATPTPQTNGSTATAPEETATEATPSEPDAPKPKTTKAAAAQEVFEHWRAKLHKPRAVLDGKRKTAVERALKSYSVEDLKLAIDGCAASPWHQGQNDKGQRFDDLELICRDAKHVEEFISRATDPPIKPIRDWRKGRVGAEEIDQRAFERVGRIENHEW